MRLNLIYGCRFSQLKVDKPVTIAVLPGEEPDRRVRVVLSSEAGLQLVAESYSPAVGWFEQSQIQLDPDQIRDLRNILGRSTTSARPAKERPEIATLKICG